MVLSQFNAHSYSNILGETLLNPCVCAQIHPNPSKFNFFLALRITKKPSSSGLRLTKNISNTSKHVGKNAEAPRPGLWSQLRPSRLHGLWSFRASACRQGATWWNLLTFWMAFLCWGSRDFYGDLWVFHWLPENFLSNNRQHPVGHIRAAQVYESSSGRWMAVFTDQPGVAWRHDRPVPAGKNLPASEDLEILWGFRGIILNEKSFNSFRSVDFRGYSMGIS